MHLIKDENREYRTPEEHMLEVLYETINFYSENPKETRALNKKGSCLYLTSDGKRCAVGRMLAIDSLPKKVNEENVKELFSKRSESNFFVCGRVFKPEYQGLGLGFLYDLQSLHDNNRCWGDEGLSDSGKRKIEMIEAKIKNREYKYFAAS